MYIDKFSAKKPSLVIVFT